MCFTYTLGTFFQVEEEEMTAINVLQQAVSWKDDLTLPVIPPLETMAENEKDNR